MPEIIRNLEHLLITIPLLLILIGLEILIGLYKGIKLYDFKDTLNNIIVGLMIAVPAVLSKGLAFGLFSLAHRLAPWHMDHSFWSFLLCIVGCDLIFYFFHRLGHETQLFWAGHITHHSSRQYNLSVAFRLPFQALYRFVFWTPLAFLGFDPSMILFADFLIFVYGFYLHTKIVGPMKYVNWIFNTPSHHRVHHSSNKEYLDTNYGGIFIIWDRLFKTFKKEDATPIFGVTQPISTTNPFNLLFDEYFHTFKTALKSKSVTGTLKYLFSKPIPHEVSNTHDCTKCKIACPFKVPLEKIWTEKVINQWVLKIKNPRLAN